MSDRRFISLVALSVLLAVIVFWLPTIPSSAEQIRHGMTREQIEVIMGQPRFVEGDRAAWFDGAWVAVHFDAQGRVFFKTDDQRMAVFDYVLFKLGLR